MPVPWNQVGDGWTLATWNPVPGRLPGERSDPDAPAPAKAAETLFLIDPAGHRYAITTFEPTDRGWHPRLVDWSGNGGRALLTIGDSVIVVDLRTGSQTSFPSSASPRFSLVLSTANRANSEVPRTGNSFVLMGNDGTVGRVLPVPMSGSPTRSHGTPQRHSKRWPPGPGPPRSTAWA